MVVLFGTCKIYQHFYFGLLSRSLFDSRMQETAVESGDVQSEVPLLCTWFPDSLSTPKHGAQTVLFSPSAALLSAPLFACALCWLRPRARHSWSLGPRTGVTLRSACIHPFSLFPSLSSLSPSLAACSLFSFVFMAFSLRPESGIAAGSPRGWEIPTTLSLSPSLRVLHNGWAPTRSPVHENPDHRGTEEQRPRT